MPDLGLPLDALGRKTHPDRQRVRRRISDPTFPTDASAARGLTAHRVVACLAGPRFNPQAAWPSESRPRLGR